jgi:hypothetical protein
LNIIRSFIYGSLFIVLFVSCGQQGAKWKGRIEEVDGVTVVKNPKEPMYEDGKLQLKEDLSLGMREGDEDYMFSQVRGLAVDNNENIYVLDNREANIKKYGKHGLHIKTIGRRGQGPGEMASCYSILISPQDEIVVSDAASRRLTFFSLEGDYLRMLSMAQNLLIFPKMDTQGHFYSIIPISNEKGSMIEFQKFSAELEYSMTVASSPSSSDSRTMKYYPFRRSLVATVSDNDLIVCGYPIFYEVRLYDTEGVLIQKIFKEYDPVEISEKVLENAKLQRIPPEYSLELSRHYPAYFTFFVDDKNKIFVGTHEKLDGKDIYDVFDEEGRFITRIPLNPTPLIMKKNQIYSLEEDEEGFQIVKRYKVTWND